MILLSLIAVIVAFGIGTAFGIVIMSSEIDQYAATIGEQVERPLLDAAREVLAWYDRDGSVGGADVAIENLRVAVMAHEIKEGEMTDGNERGE